MGIYLKNSIFQLNQPICDLHIFPMKQWFPIFLLQKLSPEEYFLENTFILKSHARQYEHEIKKEFKSWADQKQLNKVNINKIVGNHDCVIKI